MDMESYFTGRITPDEARILGEWQGMRVAQLKAIDGSPPEDLEHAEERVKYWAAVNALSPLKMTIVRKEGA